MGERLRASAWWSAPLATVTVLTLAWLLAPPMGTDLAAQVARADFFARYGWTPIDFGWYGGVSPFGYSLLSPPLMASLGGGIAGAKLLGALAGLASTLGVTVLLRRSGAARPVIAGVLAAGCMVGNLVSGRVTFALGVAFGVLALVLVTPPRPYRVAVALAAAAATASSPVVGLFVGVAAVAWWGSGWRDHRRRADGVALLLGTCPLLLVMVVMFGAGGVMNISGVDAVRGMAACLLVALAARRRPIQVAAAICGAGVAAAYLVPTPVGLNVLRLPMLFAIPCVVAYSPPWRWSRALVPGFGVLLALTLPPVSVPDLRAAGDPAAAPSYFTSLRTGVAAAAPVGRIEVVPLANYWDSAYFPATAPLARGWLRQADIDRNGLFFDGRLTADTYYRWLLENAVSLVAVSTAEPSWVGRAEKRLINAGLPYLIEQWHDDQWTVYLVAGSTPLVAGLTRSDQRSLEFAAPTAGDISVRVRWSPWLRLDGGGCLARNGAFVIARVTAGRHRIAGAVVGRGPYC